MSVKMLFRGCHRVNFCRNFTSDRSEGLREDLIADVLLFKVLCDEIIVVYENGKKTPLAIRLAIQRIAGSREVELSVCEIGPHLDRIPAIEARAGVVALEGEEVPFRLDMPVVAANLARRRIYRSNS